MSTATATLTRSAVEQLGKAPNVTVSIVSHPILEDGKQLYRVRFYIRDVTPGHRGEVAVWFGDDGRAHTYPPEEKHPASDSA